MWYSGHDGTTGRILAANTRAQQLALDALVAPARVLLGEADDELLDVLVQRRSSVLTARVGPCARHEATVPAQQRLGFHEQARPAGAGQCPAERREQGTVGGLEPGPGDLAAEHGELVAQHQDLQTPRAQRSPLAVDSGLRQPTVGIPRPLPYRRSSMAHRSQPTRRTRPVVSQRGRSQGLCPPSLLVAGSRRVDLALHSRRAACRR